MIKNLHLLPEPFAVWAFGKEVWDKFCLFEIDAMVLLWSWNCFHGDDLTIDENDIIAESLEEMEYLYKEHLDSKPKRKNRSAKTKSTRTITKSKNSTK